MPSTQAGRRRQRRRASICSFITNPSEKTRTNSFGKASTQKKTFSENKTEPRKETGSGTIIILKLQLIRSKLKQRAKCGRMSGSLSSLFVFIYNEIAAVLELEHGHVQLLPVPPSSGRVGWLDAGRRRARSKWFGAAIFSSVYFSTGCSLFGEGRLRSISVMDRAVPKCGAFSFCDYYSQSKLMDERLTKWPPSINGLCRYTSRAVRKEGKFSPGTLKRPFSSVTQCH